MKMPRIRAAKLASAMLAGGVALSVLLGPVLLPADAGRSVARADVVIGISLFQRELSPYGRWVYVPDYGDVWYPVGVHRGWRPYYDDGHWVYSDEYGWLWVSDLPWGWAPFHYGRWVFDDYYGWIWVPGRVWGPAWVTFRSAPGYIGWAPLPPWAEWDDDYGFRRRYDVVDVRFWCFVRPEGFLERRFDPYAYDRRDYPTIINRTTNITNITIINNRVVNRGIDVNHIERVTHRRVERFKVADSDRPERTELQGNKVVIYKPAVIEKGGDKKTRQDNLRNTNQGAPAQQFGAPTGEQPSAGNTKERLQTKKKRSNTQAPEFVAPDQTQPSVGGNETEQLQTKKKKRSNTQAPEFVAPDQTQPSVGGNESQQLQTKKKKRSNTQAPEFVAPDQTQPSVGGNESQQLQTKKKKRSNTQAPEFVAPDSGGSSVGDGQTMPQKKKQRSNEQFNDQPQGQQQYQQQPQQYQPQQQKKKKQCQSGDPACGNQ